MIVKVCGMRERGNTTQVARIADMVGFIFYPPSPRYVATKAPATIGTKRVGVFVNETIEKIVKTAQENSLDYIQLHGDESPKECLRLRELGYGVIKAVKVENAAVYDGVADLLLFDTPCVQHGGSGEQFDWSTLNNYKGTTPFLLSGGIKPESVEQIKEFSHPAMAGIDLNSGFETEPGVKHTQKLNQFISKLYEPNK